MFETITAALTTTKTLIDTAKELKKYSNKVKDVHIQNIFIELHENTLTLKEQLLSQQEEMLELRKENNTLKEQINSKGQILPIFSRS